MNKTQQLDHEAEQIDLSIQAARLRDLMCEVEVEHYEALPAHTDNGWDDLEASWMRPPGGMHECD